MMDHALVQWVVRLVSYSVIVYEFVTDCAHLITTNRGLSMTVHDVYPEH